MKKKEGADDLFDRLNVSLAVSLFLLYCLTIC